MAIDVARRLRKAVDECELSQKDVEVEPTVSLGLVEVTEGDDFVSLLRRAEEALRCAQRNGNSSSYYHNGQLSESVGVSAGVNS